MRCQVATTDSVSFSTGDLRPRERDDARRDLRQRGIMTVEGLPDHIPSAAIRKRFLRGADILSGRLSGLSQFGTQHGGDIVFLALNIEGESAARERDGEVILHGGDAVLFSGTNGGCAINRAAPVQIAAMRIPYRALAPLVANLDDASMRLIPKETSSLRLLATYLRAIDMGHALNSQELCPAVVSHILDLVALSLAPLGTTKGSQKREACARRGCGR